MTKMTKRNEMNKNNNITVVIEITAMTKIIEIT